MYETGLDDYSFVADPIYLAKQNIGRHVATRFAIQNLSHHRPSVSAVLNVPGHLVTDERAFSGRAISLRNVLATKDPPSPLPAFDFHSDVPNNVIHELGEEGDNGWTPLELLSIAQAWQADGILTDNEVLQKNRHLLYDLHRVRILTYDGLDEFLDIISVGNGVYQTVKSNKMHLPFDAFYQLAHWKAARLYNWFMSVADVIEDKALAEDLRSALINRYPYIVYARDMVRYRQIHEDSLFRRGVKEGYDLQASFYLNYYYLLVWGMLDHLTKMANRAFALGFKKQHCSISHKNKKFRSALRKKCPALVSLLGDASYPLREWIYLMADVRHRAAHSGMPIATKMVRDTEDSKKTNKEIAEIIRDEHQEEYGLFPEAAESMENIRINNWRRNHREMAASRQIRIEKYDGTVYYRDPVESIDFDLDRLNAVIDAFLFAMFGKKTERDGN